MACLSLFLHGQIKYDCERGCHTLWWLIWNMSLYGPATNSPPLPPTKLREKESPIDLHIIHSSYAFVFPLSIYQSYIDINDGISSITQLYFVLILCHAIYAHLAYFDLFLLTKRSNASAPLLWFISLQTLSQKQINTF